MGRLAQFSLVAQVVVDPGARTKVIDKSVSLVPEHGFPERPEFLAHQSVRDPAHPGRGQSRDPVPGENSFVGSRGAFGHVGLDVSLGEKHGVDAGTAASPAHAVREIRSLPIALDDDPVVQVSVGIVRQLEHVDEKVGEPAEDAS